MVESCTQSILELKKNRHHLGRSEERGTKQSPLEFDCVATRGDDGGNGVRKTPRDAELIDRGGVGWGGLIRPSAHSSWQPLMSPLINYD